MLRRHIVIGGSSFSGSTLIGLILGSLDKVKNVGESNWLVPRLGEVTSDSKIWRDYRNMNHCRLCGISCQLWTRAFRTELQSDPTDWYGKLAERLGTEILASSEKSPATVRRLDPKLSNTTLVLFKDPLQHWASVSKRPWKTQTIQVALNRWAALYTEFLQKTAYSPAGGIVYMSIEKFQMAPEDGLQRLGERLNLYTSPAALRYWEQEQHYMGGNFNVYERMKKTPEKLAIREAPGVVSHTETEFVRNHKAHSVYLSLLEQSIV